MKKTTYLTFLLGKELFAVNVINVLEVLEHQQITRVPNAPAHILGIMNFRGDILPVINTRYKFGLPQINEDQKNYIIVFDLSSKDKQFFISATADGVRDVIEINDEDIKPVPEIGLNYDARFIHGAIRLNNEFVLLVLPEKVFTAADAEIANQLENQIL